MLDVSWIEIVQELSAQASNGSPYICGIAARQGRSFFHGNLFSFEWIALLVSGGRPF
jgi:hypothetical protein